MKIVPNKICETCGAPAIAACDGWDDQKKDYCDRTGCAAHIKEYSRTGFHFCPRHWSAPAVETAPAQKPGQLPLIE